jgi:hypothetical protein
MTTFVSPFTGDVVLPTDVSYESLNFSTDQVLVWPNYAVPGATTVAAARIFDCVASTAGLTITLPPGNQSSVGSDILFRNKGTNSFVVEDISGSQSVTIAAGGARYFYLIDNSTVDGVYSNVEFGAGTSIADAASLVGSGLTNQAGRLETSTAVQEVSVAPTLDEESRAIAYVWTNGAGTFMLPDPSTLQSGWFIMVRNGGSGTLTIDSPSGSLIDNITAATLYPQDSSIVVFDKTTGDFFTVGLTRPSILSYTAASYDVDNISGSTLNLVTYAPTIQTFVAFSGTRTTNLNVILPAITQVYIISNDTGQPGYGITFQVTGSSQPPVIVADGTAVILLSDGNSLFVLSSQSTTGTAFLAIDGTAATPSYSFISDTSSGMFLNSVHRLGLTAYGTNMLDIDARNLGDLQMSTPAQFNAALISGGSF